jgi:hypothetical protein
MAAERERIKDFFITYKFLTLAKLATYFHTYKDISLLSEGKTLKYLNISSTTLIYRSKKQ